jgi:hypothetical protein
MEAHEAYFGPNPDPHIPDHCHPGRVSPEQYLTTRIFDNALHGEQAVGVKILYDDILRHQLWEYLQGWCRVGDFCMIHIRRNPVACYVSFKQAQESGLWEQSINDTSMRRPSPVKGDVQELAAFVRHHAMCEVRVENTCDDRLEVTYRELFLDYHNVMAGIFDFLSLPPFPEAMPSTRRLKNRDIRSRLSNFDEMRANAPHDVRDYFDQDLF